MTCLRPIPVSHPVISWVKSAADAVGRGDLAERPFPARRGLSLALLLQALGGTKRVRER
jgi:hypothetical protein